MCTNRIISVQSSTLLLSLSSLPVGGQTHTCTKYEFILVIQYFRISIFWYEANLLIRIHLILQLRPPTLSAQFIAGKIPGGGGSN